MNSGTTGLTIVAAVNNREVLAKNLLRSPGIRNNPDIDIILKEGWKSASLAYNKAMDESPNDLIVFVHQDVYFPDGWLAAVRAAIADLDRMDPRWGVAGSFGSSRGAYGGVGRIYTNGKGAHGARIASPTPIETLDEIVLILRKSRRLSFDAHLLGFHLYGTDICLTAQALGLQTYAIPLFCVHNTNQLLCLPEEFYDCYEYLRQKWWTGLPIHASCITISRSKVEMHRRRFDDAKHRLTAFLKPPAKGRVDDPRTLMGSEDRIFARVGET